MLWLHFIKAFRDKTNDPSFPVQMEIERRQPGYRRRQNLGLFAIILVIAVLLFFWLRGWEIFWVP